MVIELSKCMLIRSNIAELVTINDHSLKVKILFVESPGVEGLEKEVGFLSRVLPHQLISFMLMHGKCGIKLLLNRKCHPSPIDMVYMAPHWFVFLGSKSFMCNVPFAKDILQVTD